MTKNHRIIQVIKTFEYRSQINLDLAVRFDNNCYSLKTLNESHSCGMGNVFN